MIRGLDLSSWDGLLGTVLGIALVALVGVGIRVLMLLTIQQRRERLNRQINERLRTLIAAYKVLGGSFTGDLTVDPTHLRDLVRAGMAVEGADAQGPGDAPAGPPPPATNGSDRPRRIRDAVEAALSDIILLGTAEQVRLAADCATALAAGRPVATDALVVSLRAFIRDALDLDPVPGDAAIPPQGPARPASSGARGGGGADRGGRGGGGGGGGGGGLGGGAGMGMGMGMGLGGGARGLGDDMGGAA